MKISTLKSLMTLVILLAMTVSVSACTTVTYEASPPPPAPSQQAPAKISKSEARHIALRHSGVAQNRATFDKVTYDHSSNTYKIKFHTPNRVFHYSINARNGNVRNFDIKNKGKNNKRR